MLGFTLNVRARVSKRSKASKRLSSEKMLRTASEKNPTVSPLPGSFPRPAHLPMLLACGQQHKTTAAICQFNYSHFLSQSPAPRNFKHKAINTVMQAILRPSKNLVEPSPDVKALRKPWQCQYELLLKQAGVRWSPVESPTLRIKPESQPPPSSSSLKPTPPIRGPLQLAA